MRKNKIELTLVHGISEDDARRLQSLEYDWCYSSDNVQPKRIIQLNSIASIGGKAVGDHVHPVNRKETAFCERMCSLGLMNTIVSDWGSQWRGYVITLLGMNAIKALKKSGLCK